uniref:Uncharacterized protein n=1 Tax=Avena sativa TaxID=4498 RepID=A0ACD5Y0Q3_AVESA
MVALVRAFRTRNSREMAEQAVAAVLHRVGATMIQEATSLREVAAKVEALKSELKSMQCFLRDTDTRMERGEMVNNLVSEVRDVAYRAEIIIDRANILARENNRKRSFVGAISKYAQYPFHWMYLYSIGKRIDGVMVRVRAIFQDFTKYSIARVSLNETRYSVDENESVRARRLTLPDFEDEVDIIGFDTQIDQIKDQLLDPENKDLTVISLVDPGGAGKSTIAKKVYNVVTRKHFNSCVWICISQKFTVHGALKDIVKGAMGTHDLEETGNMNQTEIIKKIHSFLKDKRYLVVLDDVWRNEDWDMIQAAFPDVKNGSRMVITTRNLAVSNHPNTRKIIHEVKLLNNEESIELFNRKAFPYYVVDGRNDLDSFRELGKTLALKCNGLPLAIVVMGGFLSKNLKNSVWRRMVASINWDAMKNEGDIKAILDLSYYDLSSNLKACFLYITSFPEDYAVPVGLLAKLWISEGFVPNIRGCSIEETAIRCMIHLRYLGLKGGTYVLPASVSNLANLHTFDARDATVEALPTSLFSILTLKYVHIYKVESWSMQNITMKSNLKSLFILLATNMPKQWEAMIDRMDGNPSWCFGKHYQTIKQLEMVGACEDKFGASNNLQLPDLFLLPHNLRRLKISCPNLLNDEDPMPTLGSWLTFLNVLEIGVKSYTGATMTCPSGGFPDLYNLVLHDLDIEEWILEDGAMPKLRVLTLCKCTKMKALPQGLQHLKELKKVKVIAMPELDQVQCYLLHRKGREFIIRSSEEDFEHVQIPKDDR